jgi:hypothetical protein
MLNVTVACVPEVTFTAVTVDEVPWASGLLENSLIALANFSPFCSSLTRSLAGVEDAKNFSQFALISAPAPVEVPLPVLADALALALVAGAAAEVVAAGADGGVDVELLGLLEQAAAASTVTIVPASARLLAGWNRMCVPPVVWDGYRLARSPAYRIVLAVSISYYASAGDRRHSRQVPIFLATSVARETCDVGEVRHRG